MDASDEELKGRIERYDKRENRFAYLVGAALVFEACIAWCFSSGKTASETCLVITVDLAIAFGVFGEIWASKSAKSAGEELTRRSDRKVAEAYERAAIAIERAATLEKDAAEARLELERLKEKTGPRSLSAAQAAIIVDRLKGSKWIIRFWVCSEATDSMAYGNQICAAFFDAGCTIFPGCHTLSGSMARDVTVTTDNAAGENAIAGALVAAGIKVNVGPTHFGMMIPNYEPTPDEVRITIGIRDLQ